MSEVQLLQKARAAIQAGQKVESERLLRQVISINSRNEVAWLWLSAVVSDPTQESECLERVLEINPNNEVAQKHWLRLQARIIPPETVRAAPLPSSISPAVPPAPASNADRQPNTVSMIMIALLAMLGLFWIVYGLLVMRVVPNSSSILFRSASDGVKGLFFSVGFAACLFMDIFEVLKRYRRVTISLTLQIFLVAVSSLLFLSYGEWLQAIPIPLYIILGILTYINREQFTELTPKELKQRDFQQKS